MTWKNDQVRETETEKLLELARKCLEVEGDFVEMGCYRGDTSLELAEILRGADGGAGENFGGDDDRLADENFGGNGNEAPGKNGAKKLWIYDSFEGLPEKSEADESAMGEDFQKGVLAVSKREVKLRFLRANLPVPRIVKGWFSELTEADLPEKIAFAFLDGDLYESIRDSLRLVEKKMSLGGVIVVHDYENPALPGVTRAVDEWWQKRSNRGGEVANRGAEIAHRGRNAGKLMKYETMAIIMI